MGPCHFLPEHLFCLFHSKPRWSISMDNVDLQIYLLGTSNLIVKVTFNPQPKMVKPVADRFIY